MERMEASTAEINEKTKFIVTAIEKYKDSSDDLFLECLDKCNDILDKCLDIIK